MKSTGIVRRVDDLGRIVIPVELRRTLGIEEKDSLEVFVDGDRVILRKYEPGIDSPRDLIRELIKNGVSDDLLERMHVAVEKSS